MLSVISMTCDSYLIHMPFSTNKDDSMTHFETLSQNTTMIDESLFIHTLKSNIINDSMTVFLHNSYKLSLWQYESYLIQRHISTMVDDTVTVYFETCSRKTNRTEGSYFFLNIYIL